MEVDEKTMTKILIDKLFARYAVLLRRIELLEDPACELPTYTPGQWYDWSGGVCPVDGKMVVKVEFRNKSRPGANKAETWRWYHSDGGAQADIVRFRIVPESDEARCIWTERDEDDGAMFSTSCGERVEPAPGLQTYCHCCGRKVEARG